jgi:2-dehydropantoate 2-reductase
VRDGRDGALSVPVATVSLSKLKHLEGLIVVAVKSYANQAVAVALAGKPVSGPLVIMQNGLSVENPFAQLRFNRILRCVLYTTAQTVSENEVVFRPIASSPIGVVRGMVPDLGECVAALTTSGFPFHPELDIQRDVWRKAIANAVFNSICPLLDIDNGVFFRDAQAALLAREVVRECIGVAESQGVSLTEAELLERIMQISRGSEGQLISTLQDIRSGRETEMEHLNLEMARMAAVRQAGVSLSSTTLLGRLILAKSRCHRIK